PLLAYPLFGRSCEAPPPAGLVVLDPLRPIEDAFARVERIAEHLAERGRRPARALVAQSARSRRRHALRVERVGEVARARSFEVSREDAANHVRGRLVDRDAPPQSLDGVTHIAL